MSLQTPLLRQRTRSLNANVSSDTSDFPTIRTGIRQPHHGDDDWNEPLDDIFVDDPTEEKIQIQLPQATPPEKDPLEVKASGSTWPPIQLTDSESLYLLERLEEHHKSLRQDEWVYKHDETSIKR